jgi:hypothetical protein
MKNTILFTLLSIILILGACKKNAPATLVFPGGSWSFNRTAFSATECDTAGATLIATDSLTGNPDCLLSVSFYNSLPVSSGFYTVASQGQTPGPGQVYIAVGYVVPSVLNNYISTGGNGTEKVNVTVANGKVAISGSGIMMVNTGLGMDSNTLTFNIAQTR